MPPEEIDFSLVLGGPLYQLFLRTRLAKPPLELLHRRLIAFSFVTWVPPLVLSIWAGTLVGGVAVPFAHDIVTHVRFLMALPLFIAAERIVHSRMAPLIEEFTARGIIPPNAQKKFNAALSSALRLRNSVSIEILLVLFSFSIGHFVWMQKALKTSTWYALMTPSGMEFSPAGLWYSWVSMPIFQFILLRWYYRWFIWMRFLWQVSRLPLHLVPTHPDRSGGLAFLSISVAAFFPVLAAQGAVLAGMMAGKIFFEGATLDSFKLDILGIVVFQLLLMLGPLCLFVTHMAQTKRRGEREYGNLATDYVQAFDHKWNRPHTDVGEKILGSGDIQSLADLGNSFALIREMRLVPFGKEVFLQVIAATLLPVAPLILTIVPLDQLIGRLFRILL